MANPIIKIKNGNITSLYANETDAYSSSGGEYLKPLENGELAYNAWNNGLYIGYNGTNYLLSVANANNINMGSQTFNGTATNAIVAQKLGGSTVGGSTRPIYLSSGSPKAVGQVAIKYGGTGAATAEDARNNLGITTITDNLQSQINTKGIHYIIGNSDGTDGTWTGDCDDIAEYYDGLVVAYKVGIAGATTTTLNINSLGAKTVKLNNTTALTTQYPVGSILLLTYSASDEYFKIANYDSNNKVSIYREDGSGTDIYPLLFHYTKTNSLTQADGKATTTYVKFNNSLTVDPATGTLTATKFTGTDFSASGDYSVATNHGLVGEGVLKIKSNSILYLDRGSSTSLIFQKGETEHARFDTSGHFIPGVGSYNIGSTSKKWQNIYATTFNGNLNGVANIATLLGTVTKGGSTKPIYLSNGSPEECGDTLDVNISGTANDATSWTNAVNFKINGIAGTTGTSVKGNETNDVSLILPTTLSGFTSIGATTFNGNLSGTANVAIKLGTVDKGDSNTPIYLDGGEPKEVTGLDLNTTGNAATADTWKTTRTFSISGTASDTTTHDVNGSSNVELTLPKTLSGFTSLSAGTFTGGVWNGTTVAVSYGGTGMTSNPSMLINLGSTTADTVFKASPRPGVTGTLPVANGGTGATTFTSGRALIGAGTGAITTRAITNNTTAGSSITASTNLITANTLANWNGAYDGTGTSRITKLGTISKGIWNGTTIAVAYGGTGLTSNPSMLVNLGTTSADTVFKASPRPGVTGTLPVANGGTGATTFTSGQALIGNGTSAVSTRAILNNTAKGPSGWTSTTESTQLINHNTLAYWNGAYNNTNSNLSILGTITTGIWNGTTIAVAYGGTGNTSQTKNRLIYSESASKLSSSGHYASSTKVAINSTTAPTEVLYVNGNFKTYGNAYVDNGFISITKDGNPYIGLSDGINNWYYQSVKADNKVGLGPTWTLATKWDTSGNMYMPANVEITGKETVSGGIIVSGRPYNTGDDEGIVVLPATNSYAGISLGSHNGARTTLYLMPSSEGHRSVWRYCDGANIYNITHPETNGEIVVHTADTAQGSATLPVYVAASGVVTPCTASSVFSSFTSSTNTLSITVAGQTRTASIVNSISNTWKRGTTSGPTLKTTVNGVAGTAVAIPSASDSASGVVTTGAQTFAGSKTFSSVINMNAGMNWAPNQNITCAPTAANQEWSFDIGSTSYAGSYWHVWSSVQSASILACYADNRRVDVPLHLSVGGYENSAYAISTNSFISNSWIRTVGDTGWYSETYGGGVYMTDSSWVQVYNKKNFKVTGQIFAYSYVNQGNNAPAIIFDKPGGNFTGIGANSETDTIFFGPVSSDGNYTWVSGYNQKWKFQGSLATTVALHSPILATSNYGTSNPSGTPMVGTLYFKQI